VLALALPAGLLIGLSLGAVGAGGSILTVPVLVFLLGQSVHQATGLSLIIVGAAALVGAIAHGRAGRVRFGTGLTFGLAGVAGNYAGSLASRAVNPDVLLLAFAALMLVVAVMMLARRRAVVSDSHPAGGSPGVDRAVRVRRLARTAVAATGVGLLTGLFGVGGGFVVVPALVLVLGLPATEAVGTSLLVITINSVVALVPRLAEHALTVDLPLLGLFTAAAVVGVLAGNRVTARISPRRLTTVFALIVVLVAAYTATTAILHLI
jgi:uncharacterized membrane protein YfcA